MLVQSPMATGFCLGQAENLENYLFFAQMVSEELIIICTLKKCLVCFWSKSSSDFAVIYDENDM